jgi:hypothetical protein
MKAKSQNTVLALLALLLWPIIAAAQTEIKTFESRVIAVPSTELGTTRTYTYKIYGPDRTEYILDGSSNEVERLAQTVRANPDAVVSFQGEVVNGPTRRFHLKTWKKSSSVSTSTDERGNSTTVRKEETSTN